MTILPLVLLLANVSVAAPKPPASGEESAPPKIDPATLSPSARAAHEADPAGFAREHGEDLETMRRWSQDPALGQSECLAAKQDPRSCMEGRLNGMREVAKPEQLAVIQSYVKLLPRGVSAPLPAGGSEKNSSPAASQTPYSSFAFSPVASGSPLASEFRPGPNSVQFSPVPPTLALNPTPPPPTFWEEQYALYMCFYVPSRCPGK